jgi:hypothetical protein
LVEINLESTIAATVRANVEQYLQQTDMNAIISDALQKSVSNVVMNLTSKIFNDIVSKRDLASEVSTLVNSIMADQLLTVGTNLVSDIVHSANINNLISENVNKKVENTILNYNFPSSSIQFSSINMDNAIIDASLINDKIIKKFNSRGINDEATRNQLTITDEGIITTNNITAENLLISDNSFVKNLTIEGDLYISGNIIPSNSLTDYVKQIANDVAEKTNQFSDINLSTRKFLDGDKVVISNDSLGPHIINSNLRKVGNLTELTVSGQAIMCETLVVTDKRVGINTESASGALSVWDEDSEFTLVKHSPKTMFAGSTRITDVILGSNNQEQIGLRTNGTIELNGPIRFGGLLINIVDRIPEKIGEPGEIAIMRDGTAIYRCQGQNSWGKIL